MGGTFFRVCAAEGVQLMVVSFSVVFWGNTFIRFGSLLYGQIVGVCFSCSGFVFAYLVMGDTFLLSVSVRPECFY